MYDLVGNCFRRNIFVALLLHDRRKGKKKNCQAIMQAHKKLPDVSELIC